MDHAYNIFVCDIKISNNPPTTAAAAAAGIGHVCTACDHRLQMSSSSGQHLVFLAMYLSGVHSTSLRHKGTVYPVTLTEWKSPFGASVADAFPAEWKPDVSNMLEAEMLYMDTEL